MRKIVMIGKMNELLTDINEYLHNYFRVQLCSDDTQSTLGMLKVIKPDLIIISLVGLYAINTELFDKISGSFSDIPVITIGTEREQRGVLKYYDYSQFENITRPVDNSALFSAICRRMGISEDEVLQTGGKIEDRRPKVLVVDDDMTTLRTTKEMLEGRYNVTLANSGMKAMTSIGKSKPDIILLDYEMPVCDGRQTLEMIRADEELRDIPVIFLTGVNDSEHIKAVLALKPARYLLKPANPKTVIETIDKVLEDGYYEF